MRLFVHSGGPGARLTASRSYYTLVSAGNMTFRLALDTGSSDLWIVSSACSSSFCSSLPRYQLAYQSPSFVPVNSNSTAFNVSYADNTSASAIICTTCVV